VKAGDLVKLNVHSAFTTGIVDIIGIPFEAIGIVIQERGDICSVLFPSIENEIRSFMKQDLEIVSENE
jgi:hypothetical protein